MAAGAKKAEKPEMGVIGIIFEARPNVTSDAAALCLKAGSAVILRGGTLSDSYSRQKRNTSHYPPHRRYLRYGLG